MHIPCLKNMQKTQRRVARLHARIANIRANALHQLTTDLVTRFDQIAIEDLNVGGMLKNHRLARSIADMGFAEFRRQLEYKAAQQGTVVIISRWYPSSTRCSAGSMQHGRDVNAAINLRKMADLLGDSCPPLDDPRKSP